MKQIIKSLACIAMACTAIASAKVIPYISIRSQSENAARELVLWQTQINLSCMEDLYGSFSITPEYTRTFRAGKLARVLFNDALNEDCCKSDCVSFKVQGSAVENRDSKALLAENFGLPLDYSSVVQISPKIDNFLVDLNLYLGLDQWVQGLYFRMHAPIVHTRWDLGFCENVANPGEMNYPTGYFNSTLNGAGTTDDPYYGLARSDLVGTFEGFVARCEVPTITGIIFQPLQNARMSKCKRDKNALSDIQVALGWNFWQSECYHFGVNLRGVAPTGTRPCGRYLFEPIIGNGKHWEYGAGITGHWMLWRSCDESNEFDFYIDANITHLLKTCQRRTFDMCGKPLSRYMLASKMETGTNLYDASDDLASYQFADEFASVANLSTLCVDVSATVQAEIALKFAYMYNCFQFDFGYEFWGRSCEKICPRDESCNKNNCCPTTQEGQVWALKGDSFVYGFAISEQEEITPVALSSSQQDAKIFCGTNNYNRPDIDWTLNPGSDNAKLAVLTPVLRTRSENIYNFPGGSSEKPLQMYSSFNPYVFNTANTKQWDIDGAQSRGISHKLFANFGYVWKNFERCKEHCWDVTPYLGIGMEAEFGKIDKKCCETVKTTCETKEPLTVVAAGTRSSSCCDNCSSNCTTNCCSTGCGCDSCCCTDAALSQWGVWIKGGVSFN